MYFYLCIYLFTYILCIFILFTIFFVSFLHIYYIILYDFSYIYLSLIRNMRRRMVTKNQNSFFHSPLPYFRLLYRSWALIKQTNFTLPPFQQLLNFIWSNFCFYINTRSFWGHSNNMWRKKNKQSLWYSSVKISALADPGSFSAENVECVECVESFPTSLIFPMRDFLVTNSSHRA